MDLTRLRWRLRGAWQWPAFVAAIVAEAVLLNKLPVWGEGARGAVPGVLLAMALNLIVVAIFAPFAGLLLRRRRPDLPKAIATDYCGTAFIATLFVALILGGVFHHGAVMQDKRDRLATFRALSNFVHTQEPSYLGRLGQMTVIKLDTSFYRGCVPDPEPNRALCLFVNTDQSPAGIARDPERVPNYMYGH